MFFASVVLVAGRYLHDRYASAGRWVGRLLFGAVLFLGTAGAVPYVLRSAHVVAAESAFFAGDWDGVDRHLAANRAMGGGLSDSQGRDWGIALMNQWRFREAEEVLKSTVRRAGVKVRVEPRTVFLIGVCRYYDGRLDAAEKTIASAGDFGQQALADYFLGRIADRQDRPKEAVLRYESCVRENAGFYPAIYHLARIRLMAGEGDLARIVLARYESASGGADGDASLAALRAAIKDGGPVPPPVEFIIVQAIR